MLKRALLKVEEKFGINLNENVLILFFWILSIVLVSFSVMFGDVQWANILGMGAGIIFQVSIFLGVVVLLELFMIGIGYDIITEIKAGNIAMAISLASLRIGLALVISRGFM